MPNSTMYNTWTDLPLYRAYYKWTELVEKYYDIRYGGRPPTPDEDDLEFVEGAHRMMGRPSVDRFRYQQLLDLGLLK